MIERIDGTESPKRIHTCTGPGEYLFRWCTDVIGKRQIHLLLQRSEQDDVRNLVKHAVAVESVALSTRRFARSTREQEC